MRRLMLSPAIWRDKQKQDLNRLQDILEAQEKQMQEMAESLKNLREAVVEDLDWIFKTLNEIIGGERPEKNQVLGELTQRLEELEARSEICSRRILCCSRFL